MAYQGKNEQLVGAFIVPKSMIYNSNPGEEDQPIPSNWFEKIKYGTNRIKKKDCIEKH